MPFINVGKMHLKYKCYFDDGTPYLTQEQAVHLIEAVTPYLYWDDEPDGGWTPNDIKITDYIDNPQDNGYKVMNDMIETFGLDEETEEDLIEELYVNRRDTTGSPGHEEQTLLHILLYCYPIVPMCLLRKLKELGDRDIMGFSHDRKSGITIFMDTGEVVPCGDFAKIIEEGA